MPLTNERAFREAVLEGRPVRHIARRHDVPPTTVHRMIERGSRAFIDKVHLDLLTSHATGDLPAIILPDQPGPTMDRALDLMRYLTTELEQRGMAMRVHYRPAHNGLVIALEDANPPQGTRVVSPAQTTTEEDHS